MKKTYVKPIFNVTEFRFSEHIAASGTTTSCRWGKYITDVGLDCDDNIESGWINSVS